MGVKSIMFSPKESKHPGWDFLIGILPVVLSILTLAGNIRADGGTVLCQSTDSSLLVTAFSTQDPVRIGRLDINFLVEAAADKQPILDARVFVELENESGASVRTEATRQQARNKLLYCSLIEIPEPGHWSMKITVRRGANASVMFHQLVVTEAQPAILAHWKLLTFPPVFVLLFITNQWLRRNASAAQPAA
jgi:hypothetical protein